MKTKGGNPLPLRYFDESYPISTSGPGRDMLGVNDNVIRRAIGGKLFTRRSKKRVKKTKGGFIPSIMEPFVASVSKYIVPIALYSGYKLMTNHTKSKSKSKTKKSKK